MGLGLGLKFYPELNVKHIGGAQRALCCSVKFQAEVGKTLGGDRLEEAKYLKIKDGVIVDHIAPRKALDVLEILGITPESEDPIIVLMNVKSTKMGKKGIIKLENIKLDPKKVAAKIKKIAPKATINVIKDYEVIQKVRV